MSQSFSNCIPTYRHHKASGQAVVTLGGKTFYLGKYKSATTASAHGGADQIRVLANGVIGTLNVSVVPNPPQNLQAASYPQGIQLLGMIVQSLRTACSLVGTCIETTGPDFPRFR